jgi:hypothetical protein
MPHTVRRPVWAKNPAPSAQNVRNVGTVKQGSNVASNAISDGGKVKPGSIGVNSVCGVYLRRRCSQQGTRR